jgi:hypothetical protein
VSDGLLASTDYEEALSRAYLQAVAAGAGYTVATFDFDRDGIDAQVQAGGDMRPCLGVQLKATINLGKVNDGAFRYPLKARNYNLLTLRTQVPRILVLLELPKKKDQWLSISAKELVLRRRAFWVSFLGAAETSNSTSVTVDIPESNVFDVTALKSLMVESRSGVIRRGPR